MQRAHGAGRHVHAAVLLHAFLLGVMVSRGRARVRINVWSNVANGSKGARRESYLLTPFVAQAVGQSYPAARGSSGVGLL